MPDPDASVGECYQCGRKLSHHRPPEYGSPGIGICDDHGVSYDGTYCPPEYSEGVPVR